MDINRFKCFLVPTDLSEASKKAVEFAYALASPGSRVHLLYVRESVPVVATAGLPLVNEDKPVRSAAEQLEHEARKQLEQLPPMDSAERGVSTEILIDAEKTPADSIHAWAEELGADVIVMGTPGKTGVRRLVMGSISAGVIKDARVPVLVFHPAKAGG